MMRYRSNHSSSRPWLIALVLLASSPAWANSPVFVHTLPDGGQRGTDLELTLNGARLTGLEEVVFYEPGITVTKLELVNDSQYKATFKIDPSCRLGEHVLRMRTKFGLSTMHTFYVGAFPNVAEVEPNSQFATPQPIALNSTVGGVVTNEDVDYYVVDAKKGQRISVEVEGIRLGIGAFTQVFDPYVAILDKNRFELAAADDTPLLRQDCFASAIAPEDGPYLVMIRESAYAGSDAARYRLHVGDFPRPGIVFPLGGQPGETITFKFLGDKTGTIEQAIALPSDGREEFGLFAEQNGIPAPSPNKVRVTAMPNVMEVEPNDNFQQATGSESQAVPVAFNGILEKGSDYDFFRFTATQGQTLEFKVFAREAGSPIDAVVNVFKADGAHIGGNDDGAGRPDSLHVQQMPETGVYTVRVMDHLLKGGANYVYRVEVAPVTAKLSLTMPEVARYDDQNRQFVSVPRGNRWMILMQGNRQYFGGPLKLTVNDLPPGVTMHAPVMNANVSQVPVVFEAAPDAALGGKLADLIGEHPENAAIKGRWRQDVALVRGDPNGTPYYTTGVDRLAVAVTEEAPFSVQLIQPKVPLHRDGVMNVKIVATKKEGWDEQIFVQIPFRAPGMGATYQVTMEKGQTEVLFPINAAGNAAEGEWPLVAMAFANVNGGLTFVSTQVASLKIAPHLVTGQIALAVTEQAKPTEVIVTLAHVTPFEGDAKLELIGLPLGCATEPLQIKAGMVQAVFQVTTSTQTPLGQHKSLFCQVSQVREGEEVRQSLAGGGTIRVDKPKETVVAPAPVPVAAPAAAAPAQPAAAEAPKKVLSRLEQLRVEQEQKNKPQ